MPLLSIAIPIGAESVVPRMVDVPFGVIFVTFFASKLGVKMLPALSIAIPIGCFPVVPRMVDVRSGVIFETLFVSALAV